MQANRLITQRLWQRPFHVNFAKFSRLAFLRSLCLLMYFLEHFFQYTSGCLLLLFRSSFCKKRTNKIIYCSYFVENQNLFYPILFCDCILLHNQCSWNLFLTTIKLQLLIVVTNSIQFAINRTHMDWPFCAVSSSFKYKFRVTFIKSNVEYKKIKT